MPTLLVGVVPPDEIMESVPVRAAMTSGGTTPTSNVGNFIGVPTYPTLLLNFDRRIVDVGAFSWSFMNGTFSFPAGTGTIFAVPGGAGVKASLDGTFSSNVPATAAMSGAFFGSAGNYLGVGIGVTSAGGSGGAPVSGQGVTIYTRVPGA